MQKRCSKGTSCGATCIDAQERCVLELGPEISRTVTQVRDMLMKARDQVAGTYEALDTPKAAADWLINNQEKLASWALTDDKVDHIIKEKPAFVTFGVEPGVGPIVAKNLADLRDNIPALKNAQPVMDTGKAANGPWKDLVLKANNYKVADEIARSLNSIDPANFPKTLGEAAKYMAMTGLNVNAAMEYLKYSGLYRDGKLMQHVNYDKNVSEAANRGGKILWETANGLIQKGAGIENKGIYNANPSGLWKPSQQFGQFKELFQAAGYRDKDIGPFGSNSAWYKYSGQQMGNKVMKIVEEAKPKLMYFGGKESDMVRKTIAESFGKGGSFTLEAKTKTGEPVSKTFEYFVYKHPDGTNTVAMFGPHTGALGFKSNRDLMEATGQVAKGLIEKGEVPKQVANANVSNIVNEKKTAVMKNAGQSAKVSQVSKALKAMGSPVKVAEAKPQRGAIDKGKQLAGVRKLAESLARQGYGAVRVREELRKLGVPAALIAEVV